MSRTLPISVVTALVLTTASARADHRYDRDKAPDQVTLKKPKRGSKSAKPKSEARPEIDADAFLQITRDVAPIRDQQIALMRELIADTPDSQAMDKADLIFRLAELYAQKARYLRFEAMELHGDIARIKGKRGAGKRADLGRRQKELLDNAAEARKRAATTYAQLATNRRYLPYSRRPLALFFLARTLTDMGKHGQARRAYQRLIKDHPGSPLVADAYLAFADYYFENDSLANAQRFYERVLKLENSRSRDYARYKLGWVHYNLGEFQDALESFYTVAQRTARDPKKRTLARAARKDFVRAYAEIGKPELAYRAFQRVHKPSAFTMLQHLGDFYQEQGKVEKAVYTLRKLIEMRPKHELVCEWQHGIANAMLSLGGSVKARSAEIVSLVRLYTKYRQRGILRGQALSECREMAGDLSSTMARVWHNEGIKLRDQGTMDVAAELYRLYLADFPRAPDRGETEYFLAELLWKAARYESDARRATAAWERAARAFTEVVKGGRVKGKNLEESAYAAVLAWKNALGVDPRPQPTPPPDPAVDSRPLPIPEREKKMLAAFDLYLAHVPDKSGRDRVDILFLKGRTFARYHHFERARPLFAAIATDHRDHELAEVAIHGLLDALIMTNRDDEMIRWVEKLGRMKSFVDQRPKLGERLATIERMWLRKQAEKLEGKAEKSHRNDDYVACGQAYIDIYNRDPDTEDGDELLYNAGVCFENGKSLGTAIRMYRILQKRYPKSAHAHKALARLGAAYGRAAYFDRAARAFETYGRRFSGEKDADKALSNAVFYYRGAGDRDKAIATSKLFVSRFGNKSPDQAAEAMFNTTAIYEEEGDVDRTISHLRRYLRQYGKRGGTDRQIVAHAKIGMYLWEKSCPITGVDGACIAVKRSRNLGRRNRKLRIGPRVRCGDDARIRLTVVDRKRRLVRAAQREFRKALALYGKGAVAIPDSGPGEIRRKALMLRYVAASRFYLAEEHYEKFLAIRFPKNLDFDPRRPGRMKDSTRRFSAWVDDKLAQGEQTQKLYLQARVGDAHYAIASAARAGQITQNFADALFSAEIPRHLRRGPYAEDKMDAYCDALTAKAEPLERASIQSFGACLKTSTRLSWFNRWSRLCERELGQIRPDLYPKVSEARSDPDRVAPIMTTEPAAMM